MTPQLTSLIAASTAFVGSHFLMSHQLRPAMVRALGEKGFLAVYSLVSLALFGWVVFAFRAVGRGGWPAWNGQGEAPWIVASLLTIVSLALLLGSFKGNPITPGAGAEALARAEARGVYAVTRHPRLWGIALWAIAHIMVIPTARQVTVAGAMLVLALIGAHLQDRKKRATLGESWRVWEARTSNWPRWSKLAGIGWGLWLAALVGWLVLTWAHVWLAYVPAGIWRWAG